MKLISTFFNCSKDRLSQGVKVQPPVNFFNSKSALIASLLLCGVCLATTDPVFANDKCNDVRITLVNKSSNTIKITKFEYQDFDKDKLRTEFLLGVDGREFLDPTSSFRTTRNLAFIGNDRTFFKIQYQKKIGGTKFDSTLVKTTKEFVCRDGSTQIVDLN
jgi:hypothetical protein